MEAYKDFTIYLIPGEINAGIQVIVYSQDGKQRINLGQFDHEERGIAQGREYIDHILSIANFQPAESPELSDSEKQIARWIYEQHGGVVSDRKLCDTFGLDGAFSHAAVLNGQNLVGDANAILVKWLKLGYLIHTQYAENILTPKILPFIGQ